MNVHREAVVLWTRSEDGAQHSNEDAALQEEWIFLHDGGCSGNPIATANDVIARLSRLDDGRCQSEILKGLYGMPFCAIRDIASASKEEDEGGADGASYNVIEPPLL